MVPMTEFLEASKILLTVGRYNTISSLLLITYYSLLILIIYYVSLPYLLTINLVAFRQVYWLLYRACHEPESEQLLLEQSATTYEVRSVLCSASW